MGGTRSPTLGPATPALQLPMCCALNTALRSRAPSLATSSSSSSMGPSRAPSDSSTQFLISTTLSVQLVPHSIGIVPSVAYSPHTLSTQMLGPPQHHAAWSSQPAFVQ